MMDANPSTSRLLTNVPPTSSQRAHLSLHLPQFDLLPQLREEATNTHGRRQTLRHTRTSSVYDDDEEWNRRISGLSIPPLWHAQLHQDALSIVNEPLDEHGRQNDASVVEHVDPIALEKAFSADVSHVEINRDLRTRNFCVFTLVLGILIGVASLVAGCEIVVSGRVLLPNFLRGKYMTMGTIDYPFIADKAVHYLSGHRVFSVPEVAVLMINFVLNVWLTAIFDCMAFIQSTTLRWALCKEGRLLHNSNPRLFTGARHFAPNWRITNAMSSLALVMGYGSISALTASIYIVGMSNEEGFLDVDAPVSGPRYAIDFNGWGFIGLGISLLLQGMISSWCLAKSKIVPTWSSNPFNTVLVCTILGMVEKSRPDEQKMSLVDAIVSPNSIPKRIDTKTTWLTSSSDDEGLILSFPQPKQPPMRLEVPRSRRITYFVWAVFALVVLWIILIAVFGVKTKSCTRDYVELMNYRTDFLAYWQSYCQVAIPYYMNTFFDRRDWLGLIIQCLVFSFITLGLHCVELLTDVTRDEFAWRKATTTGADAGRGALIEGSTNWVCWLMFAFKSVTPWMFGLAFNTNLFVFSNLIPLAVLGFIMLLLALFSEFLVRWPSKGPQPCTFGNISKLANLVDEWHPRIFWGDKGTIDHRIRKAGTAGRRLADLDMSMLYANLRV